MFIEALDGMEMMRSFCVKCQMNVFSSKILRDVCADAENTCKMVCL